jgi:hypothetical protein
LPRSRAGRPAWAKLPEPAGSLPGEEPARAPLSVVTPGNPLLSRLELDLPDGRYLLVYSQLEPVSADA